MSLAKALFVDDDKIVADTLAQIFKNEGYECRAVYSADLALETITQWEPELAVVDAIIPGMSGIDLGILLKERFPSIAVIIISSSHAASSLVKEAALKSYRFPFLSKDLTVRELLLRASAILWGNRAVPARGQIRSIHTGR